jgi:hypothetical protein
VAEETVAATPVVVKWEPIEDDSKHSTMERSKVEKGWLVRTRTIRGDAIISVVFVPDENDMWGK